MVSILFSGFCIVFEICPPRKFAELSEIFVVWKRILFCDIHNRGGGERDNVKVLQYTVTHCNTLQHTATHCSYTLRGTILTHCNTLQYTVTHCKTLEHLQHPTSPCNIVQHSQHTATHSKLHNPGDD